MSAQTLNHQVGHLHSFQKREFLSNVDTVQSQLLSSGGQEKKEKRKQSLSSLIWQHHHRSYCIMISPSCYVWSFFRSSEKKHFKRSEIYQVVSVEGGCAQVPANLQSNKLGDSTWEPFWDKGDLLGLADRCPGQTYTLVTHSIPGIPGTTPGLLVRPWFEKSGSTFRWV